MVVQQKKMVSSVRTYNMTPQSFLAWVQRRDQEAREHVPEVEKIVPFVQDTPRGQARAEITGAIDLDRDTLTAALDAFVRFGLLTMRREGGIDIFQARNGVGR